MGALSDWNGPKRWILHGCLVFVKDSILGNWPKYECRRREENRARALKARESAGGERRAPKARESAGGERRAQRAFRRRRKRFREAESSLCYYGQIPIAFKSRYLSKLDTPLHEEAQIYCPIWLSTPQYSFHSLKTLQPEPGYLVSSSRKCPLAACYYRHWPWSYNVLGLHDHGIGSYIGCNRFRSYAICTDCFNILCFDIFSLFQSMKLPDLHHVQN